MIAAIPSAVLIGVDGKLVSVEVHVSNGLPGFTIVGLPDTAVQESRERVRSAIKNSGLEFPLRRITINLAPADIKKQGPAFDLPIAVGLLAAQSAGSAWEGVAARRAGSATNSRRSRVIVGSSFQRPACVHEALRIPPAGKNDLPAGEAFDQRQIPCPPRTIVGPYEAQEFQLEPFQAAGRHVGTDSPVTADGSPDDAQQRQPVRAVEVDQRVGGAETGHNGGGEVAVDHPCRQRRDPLDVGAERVGRCLDPAGPPPDLIKMKHWEAEEGAKLAGQGRFAGAGRSHDHDSPHGTGGFACAGCVGAERFHDAAAFHD